VLGLRAKRVTDVVASVVLLLLLVPILGIISAAIVLTSRGPVLFRQMRLGRAGVTFEILKFRTMVADAQRRERLDDEGATIQAPDDPRVTRVGRLLRQSSMDEIPQLWNVVRGDMSIVGPRPDLVESMQRYTHDMLRKLDMRPGITGLAMVRGRNAIAWSERVRWDVQYVDTWSPSLDARIVLETVWVVLTGRGIFTTAR
jgi:lipopolysaccharide/colanic/teichoic acid biosynthesis glycosyltransferase